MSSILPAMQQVANAFKVIGHWIRVQEVGGRRMAAIEDMKRWQLRTDHNGPETKVKMAPRSVRRANSKKFKIKFRPVYFYKGPPMPVQKGKHVDDLSIKGGSGGGGTDVSNETHDVFGEKL